MSILRGSKAPNLPIAPTQYEQRYGEQLNNVQRLYYNQIDNITQTLLGPGGGSYLSFPHISASDTTSQYAAGNNTPTPVEWNTLESGLGFTLNIDGSATAAYSGIFKIDYSLQFANTANAAHDAFVWLEVTNGVTTQVTNSTSSFTIPARKSAGVPSYLLAYSCVTFEVKVGDSFKLWWATSLAYNPVGPVDGVYMPALPAQTTPYARPLTPSAIGAITFVCGTAT
jgi:hypothetical protein